MERKRTNTEKLVITAILIALEVILTRFVGISTPMLRISFGFLPMVIVAMYGAAAPTRWPTFWEASFFQPAPTSRASRFPPASQASSTASSCTNAR